MRAGGLAGRRAHARSRRLSPVVTLPMAVTTLVVGILIVHVREGPPPTLQTAPQRVALQIAPPPTAPQQVAFAVPTTVPPPPVCHHIVQLGDSNLGLTAEKFKQAYAGL